MSRVLDIMFSPKEILLGFCKMCKLSAGAKWSCKLKLSFVITASDEDEIQINKSHIFDDGLSFLEQEKFVISSHL